MCNKYKRTIQGPKESTTFDRLASRASISKSTPFSTAAYFSNYNRIHFMSEISLTRNNNKEKTDGRKEMSKPQTY